MAEILSLVASIIQVASFGLSLSRTLHDYGSTVVGAEKRLRGLDKDIHFVSRIISQLGSHLEDPQVQALVSEDTIRLAQEGVAECEAIFRAMEHVIAKIRQWGSMAKWTLYFRDSKIELLRLNLDRMRGNLNLLLGVIIHGTQMATERDGTSAAAHLKKIEELRTEKEHYTQRYLEQKKKYDQLLERINSARTLGSVIVMSTVGPPLKTPGQSTSASNGAKDASTTEVDGQPPDLASPEMFETPAQASTSRPCTPTLGDGPLFLNPAIFSTEPLEAAVLGIGHSEDMTPAIQPASVATQDGKPTSELGRGRKLPYIHIPQHAAAAYSKVCIKRASEPGSGQPFRLPSPSPLVPASAVSTTAEESLINSPKRRKRDKASKAAKHAAKETGFVLCVAIGAALFPITVPLCVVLYKRREPRFMQFWEPRAMQFWNPASIEPCGYPVYSRPSHHIPRDRKSIKGMDAESPPWGSESDLAHTSDVAQHTAGGVSSRLWDAVRAPFSRTRHITYRSHMLPAELPAPVELEGDARGPGRALVGRLMRVD